MEQGTQLWPYCACFDDSKEDIFRKVSIHDNLPCPQEMREGWQVAVFFEVVGNWPPLDVVVLFACISWTDSCLIGKDHDVATCPVGWGVLELMLLKIILQIFR